jgi:hypothetical protein
MSKGDDKLTRNLRAVFGAEPQEVSDLLLSGTLSPLAELVASAKRAYYAQDLAALAECNKKLQTLPAKHHGSHLEPVTRLLELLVHLRGEKLDWSAIRAQERASREDEALWRSELLFFCGVAAIRLGENAQAKSWFEKCAEGFAEEGLRAKSLRASLNALAAHSRIEADKKRLIRKTFELLSEARKQNAHTTIAMLSLNLSWEFQRARAYALALRYANASLETLEHVGQNSDYFKALAHRACLLIQMGRNSEAEGDLDLCKTATFPEVLAAVAVLEGQKLSPDLEAALGSNWKARRALLKGKRSSGAWIRGLSPIENRILEYLLDGAKTRAELCRLVYGERLNLESAYNRFNVALIALRKKVPGLIVLEGEQISIEDLDRSA